MNIVITAATESATDLLVALAEGTATVHSERADGTFRRRHFLAEGSTERQTADWIAVQRTGQEADPAEGIPFVKARSMSSIANELHVSVSAVRRILIDLAITEELELADQDELEAMLAGSIEGEATED